MRSITRLITLLFKKYGIVAIFLGFSLEGLGLPVPMELLFGLMGKLVADGEIPYLGGVLLAGAGALLGNTAGYLGGLYGGRPFVRFLVRFLRLPPERVERFERWFRKHGLMAIFIGRWAGWGYAQIMWFAGITRLEFWRFLAATTASNLAWASFWTFAGYRVIHYARQFWGLPGVLAVLLLLLGVAAAVAYFYKRKTDHTLGD